MAIEKMKLVRTYGLIDHLDEFITSCCISGDFHPENAMDYISDSLGFVPLNEENPYSSSIQKIEEIASIAGVTLKDTFKGDEIIVDSNEFDYIDALKEKLSESFAKRTEISDKLQEVEASAEQFNHFIGIDIPIEELLSCEFLKVRFGSIPKDCYPKLKAYESNNLFVFLESSVDEKSHWGIYSAPRTQIDEVDRIFASLYFDRIRIPFSTGTPKEILAKLNAEKEKLTTELNKIDTEIANFWAENSKHCEQVHAYLEVASLAFDLRRYAAKDSDSDYFIFVGWVPKSSYKRFKQNIEKIDGVTFEDADPEQEKRSSPPVKLKNKKPFRPFEMFVEMYGLPSYGGVDITPFVAITYSLLFGIMFADLGQGLVLAIGGYLVYRIKGAKLAKILVPCGISSAFFGLLVGSVFGYEELLDPLYHAIGLQGKPISVMDSINTVLILAIGIGVALVVISMGLNVFCSLKNKKLGEALFSTNGVVGIILYATLVCAVVGFMAGKAVLPAGVVVIVAVVCILLLFFQEILIGMVDKKENYMPEKWSDYIMQNFFEVIEYILTYFSNTVSFLRVGAFVLVHAGMMMVFSSLAGNEYSVGGIISMIFGNIIVIALEGLLTGIQVLRLEFYEMFSRFYAGDGKPFNSVGTRKNKGVFFSIKNAFKPSNAEDNENVVITVKK
ncbi:MAG: V-type ATPase 116kDa subunit family protein [Oscillospiraceae bacterium]|nr:V-type ATPase 116kDa subunit family protein [Oscillospiraceae bacterium]